VNELLGPAQIRALADGMGLRPTKSKGQNFVIDPNTVRRIVGKAEVRPDDHVLEVGPGLGSLTLGLLPVAAAVTAVELDPMLAEALPSTVQRYAPGEVSKLRVITGDALELTELPTPPPTSMVANLPYNVAVPVLLTALERFPTISRVLVMVQLEVAERLCAAPGSRVYGVPSVKASWYAEVTAAGRVPPTVFWPAPRVDSGLVRLIRRLPPGDEALRICSFAAVDAAFAQRRKTLRTSLAGWAGSPAGAEEMLMAAGIDPRARGETLAASDFARLAGEKVRASKP